jgi:hypothetical protein
MLVGIEQLDFTLVLLSGRVEAGGGSVTRRTAAEVRAVVGTESPKGCFG